MSTQVAVRLETELLERLDWLVARGSYENRAEVIRAAIDALATREREIEIDEQIVAAYTRVPQTDEELSWSRVNDWASLDDDWSELR